jgi:uncharacterized protein (TIGR02391 family)
LDAREAKVLLELAQALQHEVSQSAPPKPTAVPDAVALFDELVTESELREETRQLFVDGHYPQAVEEGYKYLNNVVKRRTGSSADGAGLMTTAFSLNSPLLKLNDLKTESQRNQQLGYMRILEGSMIGIRNPRAHEHKYLDDPRNALELLALCNHLVRKTAEAKRTRAKRAK